MPYQASRHHENTYLKLSNIVESSYSSTRKQIRSDPLVIQIYKGAMRKDKGDEEE